MATSKQIVPKEDEEQMAFVQWCRLNNLIVHHSGNEIGGSTRAVKVRAIKMKKMGTSKGFPDLLVFIPVYGITKRVDCYQMCAIEMKRKKGSTTSPEQKQWLKVLEMAGIPSAICKGADAAIEFVESIRKEINDEI